jgi:hypothetical protein
MSHTVRPFESDAIRQFLEYNRDRYRKQAACLVHIASLRRLISEKLNGHTDTKGSHCSDILKFVATIESYVIQSQAYDRNELVRIVDLIRREDAVFTHEELARLKLIIALSSELISVDEVVYEVQRWISGEEGKTDDGATDSLAVAHLLYGMSLFLCGRVTAAIEVTRKVTWMAETAPNWRARAYSNLAYYWIDIMHTRTGRTRRGKAAEYLRRGAEEVKLIVNEEDRRRMIARMRDTIGFYRIMSAECGSQVKEGLKDCAKALAESNEKEIAKRYYELHELIAWERILRLEETITCYHYLPLLR